MGVKEGVKRGSKKGSYAQAQDDRVESWNKGIMGQRNNGNKGIWRFGNP